MTRFRINNFKGECCLTSISIALVALVSFTSQSTFASTNWGAADVEELLGSEGAGEHEWVTIHVTRLSPIAEDTYAIKRNQVGTGMEGVCGRAAPSARKTLTKHCGASAVWIKGDHSKNSSVRYRTSLTRYGIMCYSWEYSMDQVITYSASGGVINQWEKLGQLRAIVPDSFEESIAKAHCKQPR